MAIQKIRQILSCDGQHNDNGIVMMKVHKAEHTSNKLYAEFIFFENLWVFSNRINRTCMHREPTKIKASKDWKQTTIIEYVVDFHQTNCNKAKRTKSVNQALIRWSNVFVIFQLNTYVVHRTFVVPVSPVCWSFMKFYFFLY